MKRNPRQRQAAPAPQRRHVDKSQRHTRPVEGPDESLLYGRNAVSEALRARRRTLRRLLVARGVREGGAVGELQALAETAGVPIASVERDELDQLTGGANHQAVGLQAGPYPYAGIDDMLALARRQNQPPLLLLLDHLQDPQNVGTLLRTADVVGAHGVVLPNRRAAAITPAVVNASAGAVEHLLIAQVPNLAQAIAELQDAGVWVAGLEDDPRAQEFDRQQLDMPLALVVGAEGPGLARLIRERCDFLLRLPMAGHVASLNAATAGSIALYSLWRQRTARGERS